MGSSFPPPVVLTLTPDGDKAAEADDLNNPAEADAFDNVDNLDDWLDTPEGLEALGLEPSELAEDEGQGAPVPDDLLDAFTRRLFSDDPPEWAAEVMKELRDTRPR